MGKIAEKLDQQSEGKLTPLFRVLKGEVVVAEQGKSVSLKGTEDVADDCWEPGWPHCDC